MIYDQKKPKKQGPNYGTGNTPLDLKDVSQQVPEVDDLLGEIDKLLVKTMPKKSEPCGC